MSTFDTRWWPNGPDNVESAPAVGVVGAGPSVAGPSGEGVPAGGAPLLPVDGLSAASPPSLAGPATEPRYLVQTADHDFARCRILRGGDPAWDDYPMVGPALGLLVETDRGAVVFVAFAALQTIRRVREFPVGSARPDATGGSSVEPFRGSAPEGPLSRAGEAATREGVGVCAGPEALSRSEHAEVGV